MRFGLLAALVVTGWSATAGAQAADSGLSSGGLAPPPAIESQGGNEGAAQPTPEQTLSEADHKDSGRGLEFVWLNGEVGVTHLALEAFKGDKLRQQGINDTTTTAFTAGAGVGVRLLFFTLGARFRWGTANDFKHLTVGAEAGVHFPLGSLEPYAGLGVGYARAYDFVRVVDDSATVPFDEKAAVGVYTRLFAGVDYYLTSMFSLGVNLSGDVVFLAHPAETPTATDGSGIGLGVTGTAVLGLHF